MSKIVESMIAISDRDAPFCYNCAADEIKVLEDQLKQAHNEEAAFINTRAMLEEGFEGLGNLADIEKEISKYEQFEKNLLKEMEELEQDERKLKEKKKEDNMLATEITKDLGILAFSK